MALINNLISNLGSKDPNKKLLSNVNDGQTTSTMEGQGFSDSQYDSMAQDFAFDMQNKAFDASKELKTESKRAKNVADTAVSLSQDYLRKQNIYKPDPNAGGYSEEPYTFEDGKLVGREGIDSIVGKYGQDYLSGKLNVDGGMYPFSEQQPGPACNTYATCIAQQAKSTAIADYDMFDYGLGKKRTIKKGELNPVTPYNKEFNKNMASAGYEYVVDPSKTTNIGTSILGADVNYNTELQGGDIGRMGFGREFSNERGASFDFDTDAIDTYTDHATTRQPDGSHIYNAGRLQAGLKKDSNIGDGIHVYARYVGNTKKLREKSRTASFIANATRRPLKINPVNTSSKAKLKGNTTGLNKLLKRR